MLRQVELVEKVTRYNENADEALLNRAYVYAMIAHGNQKRASGDPYITHPLEVAGILADLKLDDATIVAALLHDTIEDTDTTRDNIDELFGEEIGSLVQGLTKIKKLDLVSKKAAQGENFRRLLLAISEDIRVLVIKLADRLHNMRTLYHVPISKRARISEETMDIYAPLAGRMGMQSMREELEDLSFRHLSSDYYEMIVERLNRLREDNRGLTQELVGQLEEKLQQAGIDAEIVGREKKPYSIWRKMERKAVSFEQLSDIFGFRILVNSIEDCYRSLGIIHTTWPLVPGRFKDYISTPKQNDYQSIHTTVIGPRHQRLELQVRTQIMNDIAENGIAAHALYKDLGDSQPGGVKVDLLESNAYRWLKRLMELLEEADHPEEFLEHTKLELFHDQVFCFTPKGKVIALPSGATPIDFAYAVHTAVGNTCVGCKINAQMAPLASKLKNGDEVDIITSKNQSPPVAWEAIAVTGKARAAIRRATRVAVRQQYVGLGRQIVQRGFERASKVYSDESLEAAVGRLAFDHLDDVLAAVGRGEVPAENVVKAVYPDYQATAKASISVQNQRKDEGWFGLRRAIGLKFQIPGLDRQTQENSGGSSIPIRGIKGNLPVNFTEGGAVPGDRIVGIMNPGQGITIYPIQSKKLRDFENSPELWLDVRWDIDPEKPERFPAQIKVMAINEPGSLAQIAQVIGEHDGNIDNLKMTAYSDDFREMAISLEVWDVKHLNSILSVLRKKSIISAVERVID